MKLISKVILVMYLCVALNGMTYAGDIISAEICALNLKLCATYVYEQNSAQISHMPEILSEKTALSDFVQDIPQMQGYDWSNVKQENKKSFAFLCEI